MQQKRKKKKKCQFEIEEAKAEDAGDKTHGVA
jgi:hypothetical protein